MAISVDRVYQTVLAIANKEQRGYITPQEFNLFANQAQNEIFEQYFYDLNQFHRIPGNSTVSSDARDIIEEKIALFENEETLTKTCQRYYYKQGNDSSYAPLGSGVCENTSSAYIIVDLPTQMRTTPSVSFTGNITLFDGDTFNTSSSLASKSNGTEKVRLSVTANSSVANGNGATLHVENSSSYVEFDSEI